MISPKNLWVSVLSLLSISLNRYLHVCHNHLYSRAFTKGRTVVCCVMLWGVGALLALPPLLGLGSYDYSSSTRICSFHRGHNDMYPKVIIAIFTVIPMCMRNARRRKDLMREKAFVRSLCAVFLLMLFCFFPFGIAMTVDATHPLSSEVAIAANFALFFNCSVNWIVYGVLNRSFRKKYVNILRRIMGLCCRRLRPRFVGEDHLVTSRNNTVAGWVQNLHRNDHEPPVSRKRSVQVLVAETSV
nr:hypothetical protein BaRGS_022726 [Batillaria attramentaria]